MAPVEYRTLPGLPGYRFGDDGSVWGCKISRPGVDDIERLTGDWHRLTGFRRKDGARYFTVGLRIGGRRKQFYIHHLILTAFVGPRTEGMWGCHNDGNTSNNRPENLRWDTPAQNAKDTIRHGNSLRGDKNPRAKIEPKDIPDIRKLHAEGFCLKDIAGRYGVTKVTIHRLLKGESWSHIP